MDVFFDTYARVCVVLLFVISVVGIAGVGRSWEHKQWYKDMPRVFGYVTVMALVSSAFGGLE